MERLLDQNTLKISWCRKSSKGGKYMAEKVQLTVEKEALEALQEEIKVMENLIKYAEKINHKEYLEKLVAEIKVIFKGIERWMEYFKTSSRKALE